MTTLSIKNLTSPQGITYNPYPEDFRVAVILKYIISGPFKYVEHNGYLQILIGCVGKIVGVERGLVTLR